MKILNRILPSILPNKRMNNTHLNFFGTNPLNRNGTSRVRIPQMKEALTSSSTKFLMFEQRQLLFQKDLSTEPVWLTFDQLKPVLGNLIPYTSDDENEELLKRQELENKYGIQLVYLGFHPSQNINYWAAGILSKKRHHIVELWLQNITTPNTVFTNLRPALFRLDPEIASMAAQANALLDWHAKNKYCSICGSRTVSAEAGYKRTCLGASPDSTENGCSTNGSIQNISYPRTDAVGIVAIISSCNQRILLGRKPIWPKGQFSCIAGFVEPGETLEAAVAREALEETGVVVDRVRYYSSQPWPFPSNLMVGCHARATTEKIKLDDEELEEARWFDKAQILDAIQNEKDRDPAYWLNPPKETNEGEPKLRLPTNHSIAFQLIAAWAWDRIPKL